MTRRMMSMSPIDMIYLPLQPLSNIGLLHTPPVKPFIGIFPPLFLDVINVVRGYGPTLNRTFSARHDRWCTMPSGDAPVKRWTRPLRTSRRTLHARPFGPGNSDQSRPSSSQTRRTTRGSRVCRDPPRGTSALRPSQWTMTMTGPSPRFSCPWSKRHPRSAATFGMLRFA